MLNELGYNVDREYRALSSLDQLDLQESVPQFYARSTQLVKDILEHNPTKGRWKFTLICFYKLPDVRLGSGHL